jgi:hypothetical protein
MAVKHKTFLSLFLTTSLVIIGFTLAQICMSQRNRVFFLNQE